MAIDTSLLVTDNSLEEVLFDKATGLPLSAGIVTFYQDSSRTTLKNIYQQTGSFGSYTYTQLANPMVLNADGSMSDGNGNNVQVFYYPYDESSSTAASQPYYVTVYNSANVLQFTRENFPFIAPSNVTPTTSIDTLQNIVVNNRFWNNVGGTTSLPTGAATAGTIDIQQSTGTVTWYYTTLAPSQHDGFNMPDIIYLQNTNDGTATINFNLFDQATGDQTLTNDVTPEFYLDYSCTVAGTATLKFIQIPLSLHLLNLANFNNCTISVQANYVSGENTITMRIMQFAGTGATTTFIDPIATFSIVNTWTKYVSPAFTMPDSITEASLGVGGDDAFYLQIGLPTGVSRLQIALPSFFLSSVIPTNDFASYDQIDSIANTPRTGDLRISMNNFVPFGWVAMNNGSIGSSSSAATNRAARDTWRLYNLFWSKINDTFAPVAGGRGASAYADFSANKVMTLTSALGYALMGLPTDTITANYDHSTTPSWNQTNYSGGSAIAGLFTITSGAIQFLYPGAPVLLSGNLPASGAFSTGTIYYAIPDPTASLVGGSAGTTFQLASSYANAIILKAIAPVGVNDSTGTIVSFALGGTVGQGTHLPQIAELVSHDHSDQSGESFVSTAGSTFGSAAGTSFDSFATTASSGNSNYFNLIQPSLYTHVFIKL